MKYLSFIIGIILFFSCAKDEPLCANGFGETQFSFVDPSLNTFKFKAGTYWVFKKQGSNEIDSLFVSTAGYKNVSYLSGGDPCTGSLHMDTYQCHIKRYKMSGVQVVYNEEYEWILMDKSIRISSSPTYPHGGPEVYYTDTTRIGLSGISYNSTLANLLVDGELFFSVKKFDGIFHFSETQSVHDVQRYYVDSIGMIRQDIDFGMGTSEVWELVRYNIVW